MTSLDPPRPWRAVAYAVDPTAPQGRRRAVTGRTSAKSRAGLDRFVEQHQADGDAVDVVEVRGLPSS